MFIQNFGFNSSECLIMVCSNYFLWISNWCRNRFEVCFMSKMCWH